jgi:hypothetical protein
MVSFPALVGALIGFALGYVDYRIIAGVVDAKLRKVSQEEIAADRTVFERKLKVLRMVILAMTVGTFPVIGFLVGASVAGP